MARCKIGEKKVKKYRKITGLPVLSALTRGGTDHRVDLLLDDGSVTYLYKDGSMEKSDLGWDVKKYLVKR